MKSNKMLISLPVLLLVSSTINVVHADDYFWGFYNRISKNGQNIIDSSNENSSFDDSKHKGTYFWGEFDNIGSTKKVSSVDDTKLKTGYFWDQFNE